MNLWVARSTALIAALHIFCGLAYAGEANCVSFLPQTLTVEGSEEGWRIQSEDFGVLLRGRGNLDDGKSALQIIQTLAFDQRCTVNAQDRSMEYYLSGGAAPSGKASGENCVAFDRQRLRLVARNSIWFVNAEHVALLAGRGPADDGHKAISIINKYGFDRVCYVGEDGAFMRYFKHMSAVE